MTGTRCFNKVAPDDGGPPLFQHGTVVFQAHYVGWIVTAFFAMVSTVTSFWLVNKHLQWYTNKGEQRYIVRLLFMVPIYALISFASYLFWNHHTPLLLIRDGYESTVLTSFFYLLLTYLSPDPDQQKAIFLKVGLSRQADREARRRGDKVERWVFPLGFIKWKPEDGLYFLQLMKWGVLQYCVIRPLTTLAAVILNYVGLYCEESWSPRWGQPYITVVVSISVSIAMFCLIQFYVSVAKLLAPNKPLLKLFSVKAIVFLTFWQATFLGLLVTFGVVKDTKYMTAQDIVTGFSAIIETFEMMLFAFLHIKAYSYKPYRPSPYSKSHPPHHTPRLRSLGHAFDFRETFREVAEAVVYGFDRWRGYEPRPDRGARRAVHLEEAFGKSRPSVTWQNKGDQRREANRVEVQVVERVDVDVAGERQWLGLGDDYVYGLGYARREKSETLGLQIEKELQKRGYGPDILHEPRTGGDDIHDRPPEHKPQSSWWRDIYNRISQADTGNAESKLTRPPSKRQPRSRRPTKDTDRRLLLVGYENDDPPPPSAMRIYHDQRRQQSQLNQRETRSRLATTFEDPRVASEASSSLPATLGHPDPDGHHRHNTATPPDRSPSPARLLSPSIRLDNAFAQSALDHDGGSELDAQSPMSTSIPLPGLSFTLPLAAKTAVISPGYRLKSEVGHVLSEGHLTPSATGEHGAVVMQVEDTSRDSPPPVPPKVVTSDVDKKPPPRRSSHRRESAFHNVPVSAHTTAAFGPDAIAGTQVPMAISNDAVDTPRAAAIYTKYGGPNSGLPESITHSQRPNPWPNTLSTHNVGNHAGPTAGPRGAGRAPTAPHPRPLNQQPRTFSPPNAKAYQAVPTTSPSAMQSMPYNPLPDQRWPIPVQPLNVQNSRSSTALIHSVPNQPRRYSLPPGAQPVPPASYKPHPLQNIPRPTQSAYPPPRGSTRRMSAPLDTIPQHTVPVPAMGAQNWPTDRSRRSVGQFGAGMERPFPETNANGSEGANMGFSSPTRYLTPNSRPPPARRTAHLPRVPVMPTMLSSTSTQMSGLPGPSLGSAFGMDGRGHYIPSDVRGK